MRKSGTEGVPHSFPGDHGKNQVQVSRFFFALPDPLPFPNRTTVFALVGNEPTEPRLDDPWVRLCFHQAVRSAGADVGLVRAVSSVIDSVVEIEGEISAMGAGSEPAAEPSDSVTVVEACTPTASPDHPPSDWSGLPQDLLPRSDAFMCCVRAVEDYVRAYRVATKVPLGPLTYERVHPFVFLFVGDVQQWIDGTDLHLDDSATTWSGPTLMMLSHFNLASRSPGPAIVDQVAVETHFWLTELHLGGQMSGWREHLVTARRATEIDGDHGAAVVLAQTASEMFLDFLLMLLMWEDGLVPEEEAAKFVEGKAVRRAKTEFADRLGGTWSFKGSGPVAQWFHCATRLRHRVVHGGYRPTRSEASKAIQSVYDLQTYAFDRLCERRKKYPRATLMTVAQPGLERRNMWNGSIRDFAEQQSPTEPNWRIDFGDWNLRLVSAAAPVE